MLSFDSRIQLKESGIPLTTGIRSLSSTDRESGIQHLQSEIHGVEECPFGFHYIYAHGAVLL